MSVLEKLGDGSCVVFMSDLPKPDVDVIEGAFSLFTPFYEDVLGDFYGRVELTSLSVNRLMSQYMYHAERLVRFRTEGREKTFG